jgi:hypothetical protein
MAPSADAPGRAVVTSRARPTPQEACVPAWKIAPTATPSALTCGQRCSGFTRCPTRAVRSCTLIARPGPDPRYHVWGCAVSRRPGAARPRGARTQPACPSAARPAKPASGAPCGSHFREVDGMPHLTDPRLAAIPETCPPGEGIRSPVWTSLSWAKPQWLNATCQRRSLQRETKYNGPGAAPGTCLIGPSPL